MLIVWFSIVLSLSLLLVILGYSFKQPPLAIAGSVLIFLLGSVVMFSSLEIKTGYIEHHNESVAPHQEDVTLVYTYGDIPEEEIRGVGINHLLGFFLSLIGAFIFIDVIISLKGLK